MNLLGMFKKKSTSQNVVLELKNMHYLITDNKATKEMSVGDTFDALINGNQKTYTVTDKKVDNFGNLIVCSQEVVTSG